MLFAVFIVGVIISLKAVVNAAGIAPETIPLWPIPKEISVGNKPLVLDYEFRFVYTSTSTKNSIIDNSITRYLRLLRSPYTIEGNLQQCTIDVVEDHLSEIVGSDESYTIKINDDGSQCTMTARTTWGILRALETFSQFFTKQSPSGQLSSNFAPITIDDAPRYSHRGLLIDTARHYISMREIYRIVDSLPANKLNVLHWHIIDAESFPLQTLSEPWMVKGAFSDKMVYELDDLHNIYNYAHERGVELIVEVDIPGHSASWAAGKKEIMADCFEKYYYNINDFALNPTLEETYSTVNNILSDINKFSNNQFSQSRFMHTGGDEVVYGCWKADASVTAFMNAQQFTNYDQLLCYFVDRVDTHIHENLRATAIHWEEVFTAGCANTSSVGNTIYQVWTDINSVNAITSKGYRVITSPSSYWYLNLGENTWKVMYSYDPRANLTTSTSSQLVIGGEAALWGEYIDDTNLQVNLYPRLNAVAEKLWSPVEKTSNATASTDRMFIQKCRLVNRGVKSAPVQPGGYCTEFYI